MNRKGINHRIFINILRRMTPEMKLSKAFELSIFSKDLYLYNLQRRCPGLDREELSARYEGELAKCYEKSDLNRLLRSFRG